MLSDFDILYFQKIIAKKVITIGCRIEHIQHPLMGLTHYVAVELSLRSKDGDFNTLGIEFIRLTDRLG